MSTAEETVIFDTHAEHEVEDPLTAKRKLDEEPSVDASEPAEEAAKRTKTEDPTDGLLPGQILEMIECMKDKVGQIIGSRGAIIQDIQARTGAKAFINQDFADHLPRQVHVTGTPGQVKAAGDLVRLIIAEGPQAIHVNMLTGGPTMTSIVECSQGQVGKIIGAGGAVIKDIQAKSGSRIQIDQDFPEGVPRKVNITGTQQAVSLAVQLVNNAMNSIGPPMGNMAMGMGNPYGTPMLSMGADGKQVMDLPKASVGKIIGKGGENIQMIQRISGARITIEQDQDPCKVNMVGPQHNISVAAQMINEASNGVPMDRVAMNAQSMNNMQQSMGGGGMGAMGGMPMGGAQGMGAYGQMQQPYGGYQMQQQAMAIPAANPYGGYGGYQQPQYGQPAVQPTYGGMGATQGYGQPAAVAVVAKPSAWTEHKTDEGIPYWFNATTAVSQWDRPKN